MEDVLSFWFGELTEGFSDEAHSRRWFESSSEFDETIKTRFGHLPDQAQAGALDGWRETPRGTLAYILATDQFPRNIHRGSAQAFAYDHLALTASATGIRAGFDRTLSLEERGFFYLPFEHSEDLIDQHTSVGLFTKLRDDTPGGYRERTGNTLRFAHQHRDIVERFGRFLTATRCLAATQARKKPTSQKAVGSVSNVRTDTGKAVRKALVALKDPDRAEQQQAYMKSTIPNYGIAAADLRRTVKSVFSRAAIDSEAAWVSAVRDIWDGATHREERHAAIELLGIPRHQKAWFGPNHFELLEHMITSGAWWDFVDALAANHVHFLHKAYPAETTRWLRKLARQDNLWLRRTSIICQLKQKANTDEALLRYAIEGSLADKDFFARKGIGWALREYSKTNPTWVIAFIDEYRSNLSPLSIREGEKILRKRGLLAS